MWVRRVGSCVYNSLLYSQISDLLVPTLTSGISLHLFVLIGYFIFKAGWHRSTKMLQNEDTSGGLGYAEVTEVMIRSLLSSTGRMRNNRFLPVWKLLLQTVHHHGMINNTHTIVKILLSVSAIYYYLACFVFLPFYRFQVYSTKAAAGVRFSDTGPWRTLTSLVMAAGRSFLPSATVIDPWANRVRLDLILFLKDLLRKATCL